MFRIVNIRYANNFKMLFNDFEKIQRFLVIDEHSGDQSVANTFAFYQLSDVRCKRCIQRNFPYLTQLRQFNKIKSEILSTSTIIKVSAIL